jgi:NTE family protein
MSDDIENVLILQGGGSLGAFGCGVYKTLAKSNINDIIAWTSIGGLNASIIAGSKEDHPEKVLEQYWLELAEGSTGMNLNIPLVEEEERPLSRHQTSIASTTDHSALTHLSQIKSTMSFYKSAIYGNKNVFMPRWKPEYAFTDPQYFTPYKWTYLFDHSPLYAQSKYIS